MTDFSKLRDTIERGGAARYHEAAATRGKLFARERIALLTDAGSFTEDGRYANALADGLPADGVITGTATIDGRPVALTLRSRPGPGAPAPWRRSSGSSRRRTRPASR
jgi:acetyl-CoA carboxylase carboxyltransferase component